MGKGNCSYWKCANRVGLFLAILFAICFVWYFINPTAQELHMQMFKMSYFGFAGMNFFSFLLGAGQTYIWAYIAVGIWHLVGCCHKGGDCCN